MHYSITMGNNATKRVCASVVAVSVALGFARVPAASAQDAGSFPVENYKTETTANIADQDAHGFNVHFQQKMDLLTEEMKEKELDRLINQYNDETGEKVEWSKKREMWDKTWVINLEPAVPAKHVPKLRGLLEASADIHTANIDALMAPMAVPNDPDYDKQWPLHDHDVAPAGSNANVEKAWDLGFTGKDTIVGVSDSGIINHPELPSTIRQGQQQPWRQANGNPDDKLILGIDTIQDNRISGDHHNTDINNDRDLNPYDDGDWYPAGYCGPGAPGQDQSHWHGTHVSGIATAEQNNNQGGSGVAPDAKLMMARSLGKCGGLTSDIADSIAWLAGVKMANMPTSPYSADVINLSLGGTNNIPVCDPMYQNAINAARRQGSTIMVAAGNDTTDTSYITPANCNGVITIGATGPEGHRAMYSNYGNAVDLGAPGGNSAAVVNGRVEYKPENMYWSTVDAGRTNPVGPSYGYMEGTSMATPLATGVVAMMHEANPDITPDDVERILKDTTQPYNPEPRIRDTFNFFPDGRDMYSPERTANGMGTGIIDACAAVYQAAVEAGNTPATDCEGNTEEPAPATTTVTEAPQTTTVTETTTAAPTTITETTTVEADPTTETKVVTSTETATATTTAPGKDVTVTETTTSTQAPSTVTTTAPQKTETLTTTASAEPTTVVTTQPGATETVKETTTVSQAPSTVTETVKAPVATETSTVTETASAETVTETVEKTIPAETETVTATETEYVDGNSEPVTEVVTTTETTTSEVDVPVTETVTKEPETVVKTTTPAPKHVATVSVNWWPLLLVVPFTMAAILNMPGYSHMLDPLKGTLRDANTRFQKQLGIFNGDKAKAAVEGSSNIRPQDVALGSSMINLGLLASSLVVHIDEYFHSE